MYEDRSHWWLRWASEPDAARRRRGRLVPQLPLQWHLWIDLRPADPSALGAAATFNGDLNRGFRRVVQALLEIPLPAVVLPTAHQLQARLHDAEALLAPSLGLVARVYDGCDFVPGIDTQLRARVLHLPSVSQLTPALPVVALAEAQRMLHASAEDGSQALARVLVTQQEGADRVLLVALEPLTHLRGARPEVQLLRLGQLHETQAPPGLVPAECLETATRLALPDKPAALQLPDLVRITSVFGVARVHQRGRSS
mmetsp:Transcript_18501/g.46703  ORF Transcript_18501/g.46703 Transcript_18501/m.46703 type:complete len:255 (-) Transcript_18501:428-1192(-)